MSDNIDKLDTYERIRSKMSEEDLKIFDATYNVYSNAIDDVIKKLSEHLQDDNNVENFIRTINESLGRP